MAKLVFVRKGSINTSCWFQHCVLQHYINSMDLNNMQQHKYSHREIITKILLENGVDLMKENKVEGKPIYSKNFYKLTFTMPCDKARALE